MIAVEHECGNGAALNNLRKGSFTLLDTAGIIAAVDVGPLIFGIVPEGLDGTDDGAVGRPDGGRGKKKPSSVLTQVLEKFLRFKAPIDQHGGAPFGPIVVVDFTGFQLIENHVRHDWSFFPAEGLPVITGADHHVGIVAGKHLQGMVPMGHHMVAVDDKGGDGTTLDNLGEGLFVFVERRLDLLEPTVALHEDVGGLSKDLVEPVFYRLHGHCFGGQVRQGILANGFQLQQVPQEP